MQAKSKFHIIPMLRDMFHDLEMEDDCAKVIDRFSSVVERLKTTNNKFPNKIRMGTKSLGKDKKSETAANQSNCSSMHPLHPFGENGEESDVEEQMPELVDSSDSEISSTRENKQGTTIESIIENDNENSRNTPLPQVLMKNMKNLQKK